MGTATNQRQVNLELLRICAILLISLMHGIKSACNSPFILNDIAHTLVNAFGNMGVTAFILLSGYFGIRFRFSKLVIMWCTVLVYSLLIFSIDSWQTHIPIQSAVYLQGLYTALTPITSGTWWFITSYFIVFMLSPLLNLGVQNMTRKQFQYLLGVLLLFYSLSPTFLLHSVSGTPYGKGTENMILAYFIGRYLALHGIPAKLQQHAGALFVGCGLIVFVIDFVTNAPYFMAKDHNLFIILGAIGMFLSFHKTKGNFGMLNSIILKGASYVFPVYLLNWWLINLLEPYYARYAADFRFLPYLLMSQITVVIVSVIIESVRRIILDRPIWHFADWAERKASRFLPSSNN